jgi:hypothetical protein
VRSRTTPERDQASGRACDEFIPNKGRVMEGLSSPHIVPWIGARAAAGGEYQIFLEFAPGGSLADEAASWRVTSGSTQATWRARWRTSTVSPWCTATSRPGTC